jgi:transposase InsO family protein
VERLAGCAGFRSTGNGHSLAAGTIPQVLGPTISNQTWSPRKTRHRRRDSAAYPANGSGQSPLARTENPWRAEDARDRNIGAHRLTDSPNGSFAPTVSDLADVLRNHLGQIVSVDFFTVPTIRLRVLFVFLVLEHRRREVLHFNVTDHPTSGWVAQQMVEAFADREVPRYLIRDRDGVYGNEVRRRLHSLRIEEVLTAPQSPWQNAYAERLIGSIRRECLNHFVILNGRHLKRTLAAYFNYYHRSRPHLALEKQCPVERQIMQHGAVVKIPQVGGLHHRYERIAA